MHDPDRAGFLTALAAARGQLVLAAGVITGTDIDFVGAILALARARPGSSV
ncbi:hypothetical protein ACFYNM_12980 [Streptomyces spororaveus]|uniref:hypothetical protein n=1 Tax=Streptomyces spororaveus TaxID=284039 RepID=UPI0036748B50